MSAVYAAELINDHLTHLRAAGKATNTIADRADLLRRLDRDLPMGLGQATVEELAAWLAGPDDTPGWSASTKATYHAHITGFFDWATDPRNPRLDWNPAAGLARPRVPARLPKPVTDDELAYALAYTRPPWQLLVLLAAYGGLRCCELATLRREHVREDDLTVTGKGGKQRVIGTHPLVWSAIRERPSGLLAGGMGARAISRGARGELTRVGMHGVSLHRFRHWFGTTTLRHTGNLRTVQELMGHASPTTTAGYTLVTNGELRTAVRALPVVTYREVTPG